MNYIVRLIGLCFFINPALACDVIVSPSIDEIQNAVDILPSSGGTVCLDQGLHRLTQRVILPSDVTIQGKTTDRDLYRVQMEGSQMLSEPVFFNTSFHQSASSPPDKNITIKDLVILRGLQGINFKNTKTVSIDNVEFKYQGIMSIAIRDSQTVNLLNSKFSHMGQGNQIGAQAIWVKDSSYIYVNGNTIYGIWKHNGHMGDGGIEFYDTEWVWAWENSSSSVGVSPYYVVRSHYINIYSNTVDTVTGWVFDIVQSSTNVSIWDNSAINYGFGAVVVGCGSNEVEVLSNDFLGWLSGSWRPTGVCPGVNIESNTAQSNITVNWNTVVGGAEECIVELNSCP